LSQVDVFTDTPYRGNPLAVVHDADGLDTEAMQRFANWTNLSETTFLLAPTTPEADYRVRIFTPDAELPFAGHPTLGSCHAWLEAGGTPRDPGHIVQECGHGHISLRRHDQRIAFAAPPLLRGGPVDEDDLAAACRVLAIPRSAVRAAKWCDNGPGWLGVLLHDADAVLALKPDFGAEEAYDIGVVGPHPIGVAGVRDGELALELRAFFRAQGSPTEDPVTGSLNAAVAQWLLSEGIVDAPYVAAQGRAIGRDGRIHVEVADGEIWVGGHVVTCIEGTVRL
jgi:PhzF family phenazine biosynthesis protein